MDTTQIITNSFDTRMKTIELLKTHFGQCFENGNFDLEKFKLELVKNEIDIFKDSYGLDWTGKTYARIIANDATKTLIKEDIVFNSLDENKGSKNILLRGDNLEVLKHLSHAYSGKIKMIYIDPPYNTGSDGFVYDDGRKYTAEELQKIGGFDIEKAKRIIEFTNGKSNSHSAWLTFMFPRLYVAKELLSDDGVIFVSIDDNEVSQLRIMMESDIFGEENFLNEFIWINNAAGRQIQGLGAASTKEYILCFAKNTNYLKEFEINVKYAKKLMPLMYKGFDFDIKNDSKGKYIITHELNNGNSSFNEVTRPNLVYKIYYCLDTGDIKTGDLNSKAPKGYETIEPKEIKNGNNKYYAWRWSREKVEKEGEDLEFLQLEDRLAVFTKRRNFDHTTFKDIITNIQTTLGSSDLKKHGLNSYFTHPKPVELIKLLLKVFTDKNDIILDFFGGSGTTAEAVLQINSEDNGSRRFIIVQLPEEFDAKKSKASYDFVKESLGVANPTIFDITKERIIRSAVKIKGDNQKSDLDLGFKIFETIPIWEDYGKEYEELTPQTTLFDESKLTDDDVKSLLTTWKTYYGCDLTEQYLEIDLDSYISYYVNDKLYLMHKGFKTKNLQALLQKLDIENSFEPKTIIAFGYHFNSKDLREISENINSYKNKKSLDIDFITLY
jgi:adenine-specific DNA-methyltransferase